MGKTRTLKHPTKRRKHRLWVGLLVFAAVMAGPYAPKFTLWFGIILLALCAAAFIPVVRGLSHSLLRLNPIERWRIGLRRVSYALLALILTLAGREGINQKADRERAAVQAAAEQVKQRRLANEANAQVVAIVKVAEAAWTDGNSTLAEEKLKSASGIQNATDFSAISQLHTHMANAKVEPLVIDAINALKLGDITAASGKIQAALSVPHADALTEARKLDQQIGNATNPDRIRAALMKLPDSAFQSLEDGGEMPKQLVSGYESLDSRTAELASAQLTSVASAREQRMREQLAQKRVAAEAERKAAEAKRKEDRDVQIEKWFSSWDGSHRALTKLIEKSMNDPDSYKHVETVYWDNGDHLVVKTTFRGKNAFGAVMRNWVKAKVDLNGNVIAVIEQGP